MTMPARDSQIEALFASDSVVAFVSEVTDSSVDTLRSEERVATTPMRASRVAEFATARACARAALGELGVDAAVPKQSSGAPLWPAGATGSISHSRGYCVAVATRDQLRIGIDIEELGRMKPAIERRILVEEERSVLDDLQAAQRRERVGAIFAAKEAFYKAHYEIEPRYLGFDAVAVQVKDQQISFASSSGAVPDTVLSATAGRLIHRDGRVIVGVTIDVTGGDAPLPSAP